MFLNRQMLLQTHFQSNSDEYPQIPKSSQAYFLFDQHSSDVWLFDFLQLDLHWKLILAGIIDMLNLDYVIFGDQ